MKFVRLDAEPERITFKMLKVGDAFACDRTKYMVVRVYESSENAALDEDGDVLIFNKDAIVTPINISITANPV